MIEKIVEFGIVKKIEQVNEDISSITIESIANDDWKHKKITLYTMKPSDKYIGEIVNIIIYHDKEKITQVIQSADLDQEKTVTYHEINNIRLELLLGKKIKKNIEEYKYPTFYDKREYPNNYPRFYGK